MPDSGTLGVSDLRCWNNEIGWKESSMMVKSSRILIVGHHGLAGQAMVRTLRRLGFPNLCFRSGSEPDMRNRSVVFEYLDRSRPELVIMCSDRSSESHVVSQLSENRLADSLSLEMDLVDASDHFDVARFISIFTPPNYPSRRKGPISEERMLTGESDEEDAENAVSVIACVKYCEALSEQVGKEFVSLLPCNLYGPGDRYEAGDSRLIPNLILKMVLAKQNGDRSVTCLECGDKETEFLYCDDLASACLQVMNDDGGFPILNVGSGQSISQRCLAGLIASAVGFRGKIVWGSLGQAGSSRGLLDRSRITSLGWAPAICIEDGVRRTVEDFLERLHWKNKLEGPIGHDEEQTAFP
jgi:GDP-L-fucose synthase